MELKAPLYKCWEHKQFDSKISLKIYHNVKEDVIYDTPLQGFSKQMCLKSKIDERINKNRMSAYPRKPSYQYLSSDTFLGGNPCRSVAYMTSSFTL